MNKMSAISKRGQFKSSKITARGSGKKKDKPTEMEETAAENLEPASDGELESGMDQLTIKVKRFEDIITHRLKCHLAPREFRLIIKHFHEHIKQIKATTDDRDEAYRSKLFIAKIVTGQEAIDVATFEFVRAEIVALLLKGQAENRETPIFHSMHNSNSYITVVCEDLYGFNFLQESVEHICAARPKVGPISLKPLQLNSEEIYCFGAIFYDIIEPKSFLDQVKVHSPKLNCERWVLVCHKVFREKSETRFMFLMDEPSALALTYFYCKKLFLSLITVIFFNKGRMPLDNENN